MRRLIAAAVALAATAGCSANADATKAHTPAPSATATVSDYTRNQAFLHAVKADSRDLPDVALVEVGHVICKQIAEDANPDRSLTRFPGHLS